MEKTKLYAIYTDEVKELKDNFEASIKDDWDVEIAYFGKAGEGDGDFKSPGWTNLMRKRVHFLIEKIKENWGRVIIWSDIDIQFYDKCADLIDLALSGKDIVYQAEHWPKKEVNVGFAAIRCNEKTHDLYTSVLQYDLNSLPTAEQTAINEILSNNNIGVEWDVLPNQFYAMSHYMYNQALPPRDVVLHHANCTVPEIINGKKIGSIELKRQQFELANKYIPSLKKGMPINFVIK